MRTRGVLTVLTLAAIAATFALFARRAFHERLCAVDDAYILTRYAEHLAQGHGFRWNVTSPPVEGFTSPLFVVLLAVPLALGLEPTVASTLVNVTAVGGLVALLLGTAGPRRPGFALAALPVVPLLLDPRLAEHASRGLETPVFCLVAAALVAWTGVVARRPSHRGGHVMAALSFLLVLARPDGAIVVAVCWICAAVALRRTTAAGAAPLRALLPGGLALAAIGTAYAGWKLWYFGDVLPLAFYMKASGVGWAGTEDLRAFVVACWPWLLGALVAAGVGSRAAPRGARLDAIVPAVVIAPWLLYSARIVHEMGFAHRFAFVLVPLAALALTAAARAALDVAVVRGGAKTWPLAVTWSGAAIVVGVFALAPVRTTLAVLRGAPPADPGVPALAQIGRAIAAAGLGERVTMMSGAAGALPYYAGARHVDAIGLTTRELPKSMPTALRQRFIERSAFDVIEAPFLPASPRAESADEEPLRNTPYWQLVEQVVAFRARFSKSEGGTAGAQEAVHWFMRYLRDHTTMVDVPSAGSTFTHIYVSRSSPHRDALIASLSAPR